MTRVACCQLAPTIADLEANQAMALAAVRAAVEAGAQLVVLPELVTSGYVFTSVDEARSVAVRPDHPVFAGWAEAVAAVGGVVVGGFAELGERGTVHNSAAVVDGSGVLAVYRKAHLWDREKLVFTPGDAVAPVVETALGRLGVLICYDLEFPELTRTLALGGADLLVVPTNWPLMDRPDGERAAEVTIAMAAARVNHVGVACCDRSGTERGQDWTEGTCIISEQGWVVATADRDGTAVADLDLTLARDKTLTPLCDALGDRRPELYGAIGAPVDAGAAHAG